jgi:hypothetical protein
MWGLGAGRLANGLVFSPEARPSIAGLRPNGAVVNSQGWSAAEPLDNVRSINPSPEGAAVTVAPSGLFIFVADVPGVPLRSTPGY